MKYLRFLCLLLPLILFGGCPASPPGPPVELPSALVFPSDVSINVDKVRSEPATPAVSSFSAFSAFVGTGLLTDEISFTADFTEAVNELVREFLRLAGGLEIPISDTQTTFETTVIEDGDPVLVKIDFGDFDIDGVGGTEGCSGHTGALPVCARIWTFPEGAAVDIVPTGRSFAAVFQTQPTEDNPGIGEFRFKGEIEEGVVGELALKYDHFDPTAKSNEVSISTVGILEGGGGEPEQLLNAHSTVEQIGPDATARKLLKFTAESAEAKKILEEVIEQPIDQLIFKFVDQFREGEGATSDFWSGTHDIEGVDNLPEGFAFAPLTIFTNLCAQISTASEVIDAEGKSSTLPCDGIGISVLGIDFIDLAEVFEYAFPDTDEFPLNPTF